MLALGEGRFPVLDASGMAVVGLKLTYPLRTPHGGVGWTRVAGSVVHPPCICVHVWHGQRSLVVLGDAEHCAGSDLSPCPTKSSKLGLNDCRARVDRPLGGSCVPASIKECYLVDPASSHMLVSKIKPCMCKYELIQTVKLRMAH